jgi:hypothetical protein
MPITSEVRCDLSGGTNVKKGKTLNVSTGGLLFKTTDWMNIRGSLTVKFNLPDTLDPVQATGTAVWCRFYYKDLNKYDPFQATGIKFTHLPERDRSLILNYTLKVLGDQDIVRTQGILHLMGDIRNLSPSERLRAYHILINKGTTV